MDYTAQEGCVVGVVKEGLEEVSNNRLVGISEVNNICTQIDSGSVNEIRVC